MCVVSNRVDDDSDLTQNLVTALGKARNLVAAELAAGLEDVGVNAQERSILLTLMRESVRSPAALAKSLNIHPGRMTRVLDRLEKNGLVQRSRNDTDRRVVDVSLTQTGKERAERSAQVVPGLRSQRFAHFTNADFDALNKLLSKLLRG